MTREVRLAYWSRVIRDRYSSGQTVREYCSANGINAKSYFYWQKRLREAAIGSQFEGTETRIAPVPAFAEISLSAGRSTLAGSMIIRLSGAEAEIEINGDVAPEVAVSVIRALREKC